MALLILGGVELTDFEVPGQITFGGMQQLAIHKMIGGARVIDAMGRDDAAITWVGIFSGNAAGERARMFDAMRVAGEPLSLAWDAFCYTVFIERLELNFLNPWWIPYRLSCTVVADQAQSLLSYVPDLAATISADLGSASAYFDVSPALAATATSDFLTPGSADYTAAGLVLTNTSQAIDKGIQATQESLSSPSLAMVVSASGTLAQLCTARGYVERSINNLNNAGP